MSHAGSEFIRRPYTGSCHCGHVKYIVYLSLPTLPYPPTTPTEFRVNSGHRVYKCNCTICHKAGLLHIRALDAPNDFFLVSPQDPLEPGSGFKEYRPNPAEGSWHFCERCGTRAFSLRGSMYSDTVDLPRAILQRLHSNQRDGTAGKITAKPDETERVQVWRVQKDWHEPLEETEERKMNYLSVNGVTLDAHNDNFDLRELHEKGYISYVQTLQEVGYDYADRPYFGGTY